MAEAACVGLPDEAMGERLCAVVVLRPGASLTLTQLTEHLAHQHVAVYKWPERLAIVAQLPRNPLGKVVRAALRGAALAALAESGA